VSSTATARAEQAKALARRLYEEWFAEGGVDEALAHLDPGYVSHASPPGSPQGPENVRALATMLAAAFSEQRYDVHHVIGDGDCVALHLTWHATHTGEFMGIPATNRRIASAQMHVLRFNDGKVAEHWAVRDDLTMLRQMGIAPG
jgi:steroid delta-isomerase-like uncharacterized protein